MTETITTIGLDVHKMSISVAVAGPDGSRATAERRFEVDRRYRGHAAPRRRSGRFPARRRVHARYAI